MHDYVDIISFLFRFLPNFSDFVVFIRIFIKKLRLLPTGFSSGSGRKPPNLPPNVFHCYIRICSWSTDRIKNSITYKNVLSNRCWGSEKLKFPSKSTWIVLFWIPLSIFAILMFPGGEKRQYLNGSVKFGLFWAKMRCWIINELCQNGT